jgi:hypothetical protein
MDQMPEFAGQVTRTIFDRGNFVDLPFALIGVVAAALIAFRRGRQFWLLAGLEAAFLLKVVIPYVIPFVAQPTRFVLHDVQSIVATIGYGLLAIYPVVTLYTKDSCGDEKQNLENPSS